ncbi:MAG: nucleoside 2-deoxyribosyltransferase [Syntrophobacteraceae bacterium]|jgi:nucleoside 2-deoxyribosyltransferase
MKINLAGPLFSQAERDWVKKLKGQIESFTAEMGREVQVIWPHELITLEEINALGEIGKARDFSRCTSHLEGSDLVIAVLDHSQVDDGIAWGIGYYYAFRRGKIIGIRTDFRRAGGSKGAEVNAMIERSCDQIVSKLEELLKAFDEAIEV